MNPAILPLSGKIAIVTGGSRSIGAAIAKRLAADGASVAITYNASPDRAAALVEEIASAGGRAVALAADAGNPEAVRAAVQQVATLFGKVDILVNNAGISVLGAPEDIAFEDFQRILAVNVTGVFVATQEALKHMGQGGRIIHIGSSMVQYAAFATACAYTLTKGAVAGFSRGLVRDLGPRGITVNTVHPGPTDSDMNPADGPVADFVRPNIAVGRYGEGQDIASAVAYLASPEASFVTGAELLIDGGFTA
ncbi:MULTISPECIES: 3-oxoacyl-ACP reductase family protein [Pseudomonas]|uniref:3-oxoacyl-ACP reductase FabG n=3 Tax=Pseudomonas chlororaphis TaxID=587753 RepID=A0AAP9W6M4_9PSED|nr:MULTISPECIES: 3-oxoacyl-ACP reductase family protein [Pseudomonas]AUG41169.1 3-oxoacyl-ACP reductase FabG [Pseudomonas chlororaphis]AZE23600.1 Enoyl-ACP reductase (NADPH) [Pseudomonas chlororaphis subsp. aureofaciens]AZE29895.1 Enoyl-ACP reductase (NADPH) [Pseudomonas chlororaphis subsp. aureofaciens]AZE36198.1 Enoyl-ACP reductase (NADPH) [Pseudomonas chlororaphis subsp. aureofaciens]EIM14740.1 oxidoreductase, short chain dehydrogenase/reductase family [Pseudomonas chlororaphis O6]